MPSNLFHQGDPCSCTAIVCNLEGHTIEGYPLFVILDVYGSHFFAPSFSPVFDNYLESNPAFAEGKTEIVVLPEFNWPEISGSAYGIKWYGAMTNPAMTDLFGTLGMCGIRVGVARPGPGADRKRISLTEARRHREYVGLDDAQAKPVKFFFEG